MPSEAQRRATKKFEEKNYFKTLVRFKKADEERIRAAAGDSLNGFIVKCVLDGLETSQKDQTESISEPVEEVPQESTKPEFKPITEEENAEFLRLIANKKAEQDRKAEEQKKCKEEQERQEKEEQKAELLEHLERIRNGEQMPEDEEKEKLRRESVVKARLQY